ncbi:DUF58 domain-containing protein [Nitrospira sp. NS4]|uniref:DUF58 domain-containing protein n=1 Tax=Nitrospira sp. NS4 TaxID=3414498 RepID=UPI003C2D6854
MLNGVRRWFRRATQRRSTRVTSEGTRFLFFTLAVSVAAINTGNNLFYLLLAMMLSIVMMSGVAAEFCLRRLEFHRHLPDLIYLNEPTTATLVVTNRKDRMPSFSLRLWDVVGEQEINRGLTVRQLMPGASRMLPYPLVATKRGRLPLGGVRVGTSFPFGLFLKKAYYPLEGSVVVSPAIVPVEDGLLADVIALGQERSLQRRGHGSDLYNLRQYHTGDDSRNIHWLSTARTSKLMVRETEAEDQRRVTVMLSMIAPRSHDAVFEVAVSMAASLVWELTARGYQIRTVVGMTVSAFGQGEAHLACVLETLALCDSVLPESEGPGLSPEAADSLIGEAGVTIAILPWGSRGLSSWRIRPDVVIDEPALRKRAHVV